MPPLFSRAIALSLCLLTAFPAAACESLPIDLESSGWLGWAALGVFVLGYVFVFLEERLHLRKSMPVTIVAGLIWILVMTAFAQEQRAVDGVDRLRETLLEYAELMLFLLSAMTYVNALEDRGLFDSLRARLIGHGFSLRALYWICGTLAFFLSPIADNLTTALVLAAVAIAVGQGNKKFISVSCINIVVAANAGGAFSPFGDITTLMVWQKGVVAFEEFFALFLPALVSWLIPAAAMATAISNKSPDPIKERVRVKKGGYVIAGLFLLTIAATVLLHHFLHLPPFLGMMTGLGVLKLYGHFITLDDLRRRSKDPTNAKEEPFDIFVSLRRVEWDTLMFFYGVMLCVGGLGALGYLNAFSGWLYTGGDTMAHSLIGLLSAVIDNIPVMFAVLSMEQNHSLGQWLLVTLTAGIGGSLLSIGSAAGVALMGQARGNYTFASHLKWSWAILIGYAAGIGTHLVLNADLF